MFKRMDNTDQLIDLLATIQTEEVYQEQVQTKEYIQECFDLE